MKRKATRRKAPNAKIEDVDMTLSYPAPWVVTINGHGFPGWPMPNDEKHVIVDLRLSMSGKVNGRNITLPVFLPDRLGELGLHPDVIQVAGGGEPKGFLVMRKPTARRKR